MLARNDLRSRRMTSSADRHHRRTPDFIENSSLAFWNLWEKRDVGQEHGRGADDFVLGE